MKRTWRWDVSGVQPDVALSLFGRTNQQFSNLWVRLSLPPWGLGSDERTSLVEEAIEGGHPIDISSGPALWGSSFRGRADAKVVQFSCIDVERAVDSTHAADLIQAHLIETLSAIGREWIDFYFLRSRGVFKEFQISGALEALESARQEGHIRFLGLSCEGAPQATLANWQLHDGFEMLAVGYSDEQPDAVAELGPVARQRRCGVVIRMPVGTSFTSTFLPRRGANACLLTVDSAVDLRVKRSSSLDPAILGGVS